jgi:hypothetical protein
VGYKILGFVVWKGGKWYLKRRYPAGGAARRAAAVGIVGAAVAVLVARSRRAEA